MAYPKDDNEYVEGVVTYVVKEGQHLKVGHRVEWFNGPYEGCEYQPIPDFEVKEGMKIRMYAFMSPISRGVYISGRVVRKYITKEQALERARKHMQAVMADIFPKKPKN